MNRSGCLLLFVSLLTGCAHRAESVRTAAAMPIATFPLPNYSIVRRGHGETRK